MVDLLIPLQYFDREQSTALHLSAFKASSLPFANPRIVAFDQLPPIILEEVEMLRQEANSTRSSQGQRALEWEIQRIATRFFMQMELQSEPSAFSISRANDLVDTVLTVLKLFKEGLVASDRVFVLNDNSARFFRFPHYVPWNRPENPPEEYFLSKGEETGFSKFWTEFSAINTRNFGVYRFHLANFRPFLADRYVDHVESLEFLFVPDSFEREIGLKFRTRGALLLANAKEVRKNVLSDLRNAYGLRSAIVHGNSSKEARLLGDSTKWEEKIRIVGNYNRSAIRLFFRNRTLDENKSRLRFLKKEAKV